MSISKSVKKGVLIGVYLPCILLIMCLYIIWIGMYSYKNEAVLGILIGVLGMLYICAFCCIMTQHPYYGSCVMFISVIIVVSIAVVSRFRQIDGTQGGTFLSLGITPFILALCFASSVGTSAQVLG